MNQPDGSFQEKTQDVRPPFLDPARSFDAGDKGNVVDRRGQRCIDVHEGCFQGGHGLLFSTRLMFILFHRDHVG